MNQKNLNVPYTFGRIGVLLGYIFYTFGIPLEIIDD